MRGQKGPEQYLDRKQKVSLKLNHKVILKKLVPKKIGGQKHDAFS